MPTREQINQFVDALVSDGFTDDEVVDILVRQGWAKKKTPQGDEFKQRLSLATFGASPDVAAASTGEFSFREHLAAAYYDINFGFGYDVHRALQDQGPVASQLLPPPVRLGAALGKAMFGEPAQDAPQWRKDIRAALEMADEEATLERKALVFGSTVGLDLIIGNKGRPLKALGRPFAKLAGRGMRRVAEMLPQGTVQSGMTLAARVLGDDFLREGYLVGRQFDDAFAAGLVEDVAEQTADLGAAIRTKMFEQAQVREVLIGQRKQRHQVMREFQDVEQVAEQQFRQRFAALVSKWVDAYETAAKATSSRGFSSEVQRNVKTVMDPHPRTVLLDMDVRPKNEASFLDVGRELAEEEIRRGAPGVDRALASGRTGVEQGLAQVSRAADPKVSRALPGLEMFEAPQGIAIGGIEQAKLLEVMEQGFRMEAAKLEAAFEGVWETIRGTGKVVRRPGIRELIQDTGKEALREVVPDNEVIAILRDHFSRAGTLEWIFAKTKNAMQRNVAWGMERAWELTKKQKRLDDDAMLFAGVLAEQAARHPSLFTQEGVKAAEILDNGSGLLQWVRRQLTGGVAAEFNEGALAVEAARYEDPAIRKLLLQDIPAFYSDFTGRKSAALFRANQVRQELSNSVSEYARFSGKSVQEVGEMITEARKAGSYSRIPDSRLREAAESAQEFIDRLSVQFIKLGVDEELAKTITANLGKYMHLSYANQYVDNWAEVVKQTAKWDTAFEFLRDRYGVHRSPAKDGLTDSQIRGLMMWLLHRHEGGALNFARGDLPRQYFKVIEDLGLARVQTGRAAGPGAQNLNELKHLTDMPPAIRELLGANKDFVLDFEKTAALMIHDLEATAFLRRVFQKGVRAGVIRQRAEEAGKGAYDVEFVFDRLSPEDATGFVTQEFATALQFIDQHIENAGFLQFLNGIVKAGKIVPSPGTQFRNLLSLIPMMSVAALNPLVDFPGMGTAMRRAVQAFKLKTVGKGIARGEAARELTRAHELNLIGTGALSGELEIWHRQVQSFLSGDTSSRKFAGAVKKALEITGKRGENAWNFMRRAYTGIDDMGKYFGWQVMKRRLQKLVRTDADRAFIAELYGSSDVEVAAANMIKDTMQHFPRTPALGKTLSRNVLVGTFVSFPLEMTRNLVNSLRFASREIGHGIATRNNTWVAHGLTRVAGIAAGAVSWLGAGALTAKAYGITRRKMDAFRRRLAADWARNNEFIFLGKDGTTYTYLDSGYANPYSEVLEMIEAALIRPGSLDQRVARVARQLEDVLLSKEIFAGAVIGLATNQRTTENFLSSLVGDKEARRLVSLQHPEQLMERLYWFFRQVAPGGVVSAERMVEAFTDRRAFGLLRPKRRFTSYEPEAEVLSLFGLPRVTRVDAAELMGYQFRVLGKDMNEFAGQFRKELRDAVSPQRRIDVINLFQKKWEKTMAEALRMRSDAFELDVPLKDIEAMIDAMSAPNAVKNALKSGMVVDLPTAYPEKR